MSELDSFIVRGHQKVIDHFRWLRDTAPDAAERDRFQHCMDEEQRALDRFVAGRTPVKRAA
jgi:hypothetical protein